MKWEKPHPSNAEAAQILHDRNPKGIRTWDVYLQTVIADRVAGIEEALTVLALHMTRSALEPRALGELADRVEAEAHKPIPRRGKDAP